MKVVFDTELMVYLRVKVAPGKSTSHVLLYEDGSWGYQPGHPGDSQCGELVGKGGAAGVSPNAAMKAALGLPQEKEKEINASLLVACKAAYVQLWEAVAACQEER